MARIEAGEKIIIDGATGTELERHGVPQLENAWNGGGTLSHPEILSRFIKNTFERVLKLLSRIHSRP